MKGYRFYEEFSNKRKGISEGNCIALLLGDNGRPIRNGDGTVEAIVAPYPHKNCAPCSGSTSIGHLRAKCKRVTEKRARRVHPALFAYLEQ